MLKYPVLLVHGMGFRDRKILNYWGRIPAHIKQLGCKIYYGNQDSNASVEENGKMLAARIEGILEETGAEKLNVIAHSKGGLDMRYVISALGMGDKVASLTTLSTPHLGSKTVDRLLCLPDLLVRFTAKCTDLWMRIMGDENPDTYSVFHSLSTYGAAKFNSENPDSPAVYYQSYAFVMKHFYSDILLWFPGLVVKLCEGENDGLLSPESVKWEDFRGIIRSNSNRGISHCDEVDLRRHRLTKKQGDGIGDIIQVYENIVERLENMGF